MVRRLVVNADDFGRSSSINAGIMEAHLRGVVTSASVMTDREAFQDAVHLAREHPTLGIGLHLDLDAFFDVEHGVGRLRGYRDPSVPLDAIIRETERQIEKACAAGLTLTHLDGHHHCHLRPELIAAVAALTARHRIPVIRYFSGFYEGRYAGGVMRWVPDLIARFGLQTVDTFFAGWEPVESSLPGYRYVDWSSEFQVAELMVHPGKGEPWRERELEHCKDPAIRRELSGRGIELVSFAAISRS